MAGSKNGVSSIPDSTAVAKKIVIHSKSDPYGEKFLKYLQHANVLKKGSSNGRSSSPWLELRTNGAIGSIMEALKKVFVSQQMKSLTESVSSGSISGDEAKSRGQVKAICNLALSIMSNAFALDYSVRAQAVSNGFIFSLQQFISSFIQDGTATFNNAELIGRAVKCTANLSNDSHCRESVLRTGVAISILKILELADERVGVKIDLCDPAHEKSFLDKSSNSNLICSCVRAIRILASDSKFTCSSRDHLLKFGGLVAVINVLTWDAKLSSNDDLVLDVIRALTLLSIKIRSAPSEVVYKLIYNPEVSKIRCLVRLFESSEVDGKLYSPVINCLINLSSNKEISDCLGELRMFHIILDKLDCVEENSYYGLVKLMMALTRYSSFNQSHLATSPLIGSTLKIFKSSRFKEFHDWLLMVYEKLYEGSLSKLVECGLVSHLCNILRDELEDCDYDSLRKKISSFDDGRCSVHLSKVEGTCPFAPVYRCSSPSYQKIQEEMKFVNPISEENRSSHYMRGDDSLSPFSSPAHSWSSGNSSPSYSGVSHASFSEDEGCFSPSTSPAQKRLRSVSPEVSIGPEKVENTNDEMSPASFDIDGDSDSHEPALKRLKLDDGPSSLCANNGTTKIQPSESLEALKAKGKKIVTVLNILFKCTHIKPFPDAMLEITPILLGIIVRGKVSLMPQRIEYQKVESDDEFSDLSRRTFEVSYKIILRMCSIIKIFPELIISGIVPVLHRLQEPTCCSNVEMEEQMTVVQEYCTNLITRMVGLENDTAGWREGFIMRTLLVNNSSISPDKMNQMALNIPLLYRKHPNTLRKFEMKAKSWTKILEMLVNSDETSFYRFEDCVLALCSICSALGVKWNPQDFGVEVPLLFNVSSISGNSGVLKIISKNDSNNSSNSFSPTSQNELTVQLTLDDGNTLIVKKDLLVNASPVFSAMFNGHFVEAGEQKVHLPNVSIAAVCLLIHQIYMLNEPPHCSDEGTNQLHQLELLSIFELLSLADRFLLENVYERAVNTLITQYICPYSAPVIYAESVKLSGLHKSGNNKQFLGDSGLNLYILKYILTATCIRMSERCNAIRKVFDIVMPEDVVRDLKLLIERHMYKPS